MPDEDKQWLYVKNWWTYQHYRDRRPPWIKLYRAIDSDSDFKSLTELEQWRLVRLWLLASDNDGRLPNETRLIRRLIAFPNRIELDSMLARYKSKGLISEEDIRGQRRLDASPKRQRQNTETEKKEQKPSARKEREPSSLFVQCKEFSYHDFESRTGQKPGWKDADYIQAAKLLKRKPDTTFEEWKDRWQRYAESDDEFTRKQRMGLAWFASNFDRFMSSNGFKKTSAYDNPVEKLEYDEWYRTAPDKEIDEWDKRGGGKLWKEILLRRNSKSSGTPFQLSASQKP